MKIPETSANVGAYYGNEENGQWQPNGVIIDSGVGGGVVGSGDAGLHRPVYPLHIPRGHVSGYVMAGTYYGPAGGGVGAGAAGYAQGPPPDDFADYMWMEHEEEFDKQVMQQLEEEALMEQCIEAMLEDEQRERHRPAGPHATASNGTSLSLEETVSRSTLNPLAAEFVPTRRAPATEDKTVPATEAPPAPADDPPARAQPPLPADTSKTEEAPTLDPPEVSAADVQPDRREKKQDNKKTLKQDNKKVKPVAVKSDTKVQQSKKKEVVKTVKSESRVGEHTEHTHEPAINTHTPTDLSKPTPVSAPSAPSAPSGASEQLPAGPKPINYAAAAKANKPKKPPTPPTIEKTPPPAVEKKITEKRPKDKVEKTPTLKEKPARKNSAK